MNLGFRVKDFKGIIIIQAWVLFLITSQFDPLRFHCDCEHVKRRGHGARHVGVYVVLLVVTHDRDTVNGYSLCHTVRKVSGGAARPGTFQRQVDRNLH